MTRATVPGIMDMEYRYTAGQNNGRIWQSKDWIGGEEVTYTYDSLQRLASATTTGTQWGEAYSYDGFGNLTGKTTTKGSAPALSVVYNPATNQPYNGNYDANGNAPVGTWDIENRLVGETLDGQAIAWGYDPSGKRVMRLQTVNGLPKWSFYLYDSGGRRLAQFGCAAGGGVYTYCVPYTVAAEGTETYFGGKLIASTDTSGHLLGATDRLGTVRGVQTNGTWAEPTYFPYGEPRTAGGVDGKEQFATYVRDSTASAQDYAGQRYYSNITGRFSSPDPIGRAAVSLKNPLSWNQYAYVQGDPINAWDPGGTYAVVAGSAWCNMNPDDSLCQNAADQCDPSGLGFMSMGVGCGGGAGPVEGPPASPPPPPVCDAEDGLTADQVLAVATVMGENSWYLLGSKSYLPTDTPGNPTGPTISGYTVYTEDVDMFSVFVNRTQTAGYPSTIGAVATQPGQFGGFSSGPAGGITKYDAAVNSLEGSSLCDDLSEVVAGLDYVLTNGSQLPVSYLYWKAINQGRRHHRYHSVDIYVANTAFGTVN